MRFIPNSYRPENEGARASSSDCWRVRPPKPCRRSTRTPQLFGGRPVRTEDVALGVSLVTAGLGALTYRRERRDRRVEMDLLRKQVLGETSGEIALVGVSGNFNAAGKGGLVADIKNVGKAAARGVEIELRHDLPDRPGVMKAMVTAETSAALMPGEGVLAVIEMDRSLINDDASLWIIWEDATGLREAMVEPLLAMRMEGRLRGRLRRSSEIPRL
jgi:hypothetical protein